MGVLPALREAVEDNEEELSALASGAVGGGLAFAVLGGLNGRAWGWGEGDSTTQEGITTTGGNSNGNQCVYTQ